MKRTAVLDNNPLIDGQRQNVRSDLRSIVHGSDGDFHAGCIAPKHRWLRAHSDRVLETGFAVKVRGGRERESAVPVVGYRTVFRLREALDHQRAGGAGVVGRHVQHSRHVLVGDKAVVAGIRWINREFIGSHVDDRCGAVTLVGHTNKIIKTGQQIQVQRQGLD